MIFLINSERSLTLSGSVVILRRYENTVVRKENNNNIFYSTILFPELPSSAILENTPERNQHQHCLRSG